MSDYEVHHTSGQDTNHLEIPTKSESRLSAEIAREEAELQSAALSMQLRERVVRSNFLGRT